MDKRRSEQFDLVISGGRLVTAESVSNTDIGINDGKISALGKNLSGRKQVDASGLLVLPGAIDPHVHLEMPVGITRSSDNWFTGTRAAACGGTTTVIDFVEPANGQTLVQALNARRKLAESQVAVDFSLHMTLVNDDPKTLSSISNLVADGCTSFKTYLTYDGFRLSDKEFLKVLCSVKEAGGITLVHAENDAIIAHLKEQFRHARKTSPRYHALSRPAIAEGEAITRSLAMAEVTDARLYVVHVSTAQGADAIRSARQRGVNVIGETCPHYLLLTAAELSRPGFTGAKFVCSPPLRSIEDSDHLWQALTKGDLQTVGTDHCPFNYKGQKDLGRHDYEKIPGGLPGIESRLALLYHFGVVPGRLSLNRWVEACCAKPARVFGLYPRKGSLEIGTDADIVLFDPHKQVTLSHRILHEQVDYTPYEGTNLTGFPIKTFLHGKLVADRGEFLGSPGDGNYLARTCGE